VETGRDRPCTARVFPSRSHPMSGGSSLTCANWTLKLKGRRSVNVKLDTMPGEHAITVGLLRPLEDA